MAVGTLVAIGAAPVMTGVLTLHVTRRWALATTIAVTGLALLVAGQRHGGVDVSAWGVVLALAAATSYATYIIGGDLAQRRGQETQTMLSAAFAVAALLALPWLVLGDRSWLGTGPGLALLGFLVVVPTLLAYSLFNRGLRGTRASTAATLGLVEPVVAALLAFLLLGERLTATGLVGAALILLGLLVAVRDSAATAGTTRQPVAPTQVGQSPRA